MIYTTLKAIKAHDPCSDGWKKLLTHLSKTKVDDEPLPFHVILKSNGLGDAIWACRAAPEHSRTWRLFGVWCARQVQHLMLDQRSLDALDVAERHANGNASDEELSAARSAAESAVRSAAWSAESAAWSAEARSAARSAVRSAAWSAESAAWSAEARSAAWSAAESAAWSAEARDAQAKHFLSIVGEE